MTQINSAHPREGGDPCDLSARVGHSARTSTSAWVPAFAGMSGIVSWLAPTVALAHPGDHGGMSLAQIAHHIVTSPDHLLEVGFLGLMVFGEGLRIRRRWAR